MKYIQKIFFIAALTFVTPLYAQTFGSAQAPAAKFDQYPSFIEMSASGQNGGEALLRCGYGQNGTAIVADPGYMETSALNPAGSYTRYQRIDNKILLTIPAGNSGRFIVEVVEPTGMTIAKNCQINTSNDTLLSCVAAQPFMTAQDAANQDQAAAGQCGDFFNKSLPQLNGFTYNQQKTNVFKNALRQKVAVLEEP